MIVGVNQHERILRIEIPDLGNPLLKFLLGVSVVISLPGMIVFPPFLSVSTVETHIGHRAARSRNRRHQPAQARLVDGSSEIHKMVLSRFYMDEQRDFWTWT